jgi:type IV secretory pathway VirB9-like protein
MIAASATVLPTGDEWSYEVKWDGYRSLALKDGADVRLVSRNSKNLTAQYPAIAAAVGELILDVICGDKDFWIISATHNMAHVKPAKEGAASNLNLVTGSGAVYSFLLNEKSGTSTPDLKVYVKADPDEPRGKPRYYTAAQFDGVQAQLLDARNAVDAERRRATEAIAGYQQAYPATLQFVYGTPKYEKPFLVRAIWHDGQFTYVKTDATELPALSEVKDGTPSLVNFQVHSGTYVVPKVLERGYLALGKAQFAFAEQGR